MLFGPRDWQHGRSKPVTCTKHPVHPYVRYYATAIVDGTSARVQRSERLCEKNDKYYKFQDWGTAHFIRELLVDLPLAPFYHALRHSEATPACTSSLVICQ